MNEIIKKAGKYIVIGIVGLVSGAGFSAAAGHKSKSKLKAKAEYYNNLAENAVKTDEKLLEENQKLRASH